MTGGGEDDEGGLTEVKSWRDTLGNFGTPPFWLLTSFVVHAACIYGISRRFSYTIRIHEPSEFEGVKTHTIIRFTGHSNTTHLPHNTEQATRFYERE
jgi:hypothetical protein